VGRVTQFGAPAQDAPANAPSGSWANQEPASRRRAWIVSELYYPEETSTGHVMTSIAEQLAQSGWEVGAVCAQPTYSARGTRAPRRELRNGVRVQRAWSTTFDKNWIFGRLLNGITSSLSVGLSLFRHLRHGDRALVVTNPPLLPFLVLAACRARGAVCVLLVHDVHPEQMVAFGMLRDDSWHVRLIKAAMRGLYRRLDHIIVIGRDMADIIRDKLGGATVPISVVTNWADEDVVQPVAKERSARLANLGWADKFVVQYAGNMGRPNAIELVLDAATLLRDDPRIRFLFVGSGAKRPWLEREVERRRLTSVRVQPPVPRNEQSELLGAADASVIPLIPGMLGLGVPSRTYNVLAAGRPLVAISHPDSELARLVQEERVGWFVPDLSDAHQLATVLQTAASLPECELSALKARARDVAVHRYARQHVIRKIEKVLDSPVSGWVV